MNYALQVPTILNRECIYPLVHTTLEMSSTEHMAKQNSSVSVKQSATYHESSVHMRNFFHVLLHCYLSACGDNADQST